MAFFKQQAEPQATAAPTMLTIREVAATGILPETALRTMLREGRLPCIYIGVKALINYEKLIAQLNEA